MKKNIQSAKPRPPPLRGNVPLRNVKMPGPTIKLDIMDELLPKKMNVNKNKQIMNIGSSIPKLSDHTDRLGIKLKNFESPSTGPPSLLKGKPTSRNKLNTQQSADVLTKFGTKKTDNPVGRKPSLENRQSIHTKFQPKAKLMHSFLMGDKEIVSEEMTKLHKLVESNVDTTLGFGYSDSDQRREANLRSVSKQSNNPITIVNPDSESTFRAINAKIDSQVSEWMRNTPRLKESVGTIKRRPTNSQLLTKMSSTETAGPPKPPIVHEKLKEISDQFHKSLSNATRGIKDLIQTPDDEYIHELSQKTHNALAKISIKEKDIDDIILNAVNRQISSRENKVKKSNSLPREFMPLHNDPETHKKLQNYVERRKESFAPRPPRKDFSKDYKNATVLFDGINEILPAQMKRRTSLLEASEPQVFQRKIDNGQLDNHRRIVDPGYPHPIMQRKSSMLSQNMSSEGATGWSARGSLKQRGPPKMNDNVGSQGERISDAQNNYRPNSRRGNITSNLIDTKIGNSAKNIGDAAKVANALGSLMSKISLSNDSSETHMELTGPLQPPPFGSKSLRKLESPEKRKNDIIDLALELRQMADSSENIYKTALGKMSNKFSTIDQMNKKKGVAGLPKPYKDNLPLIPDVSYTDQILLKKLKSMQNDTN